MAASGGGLCKRGHRFAQEVVGALYGHALAGVRVLRFDGAFAPMVLKFDSGFAAEGFGGRLRRQYG